MTSVTVRWCSILTTVWLLGCAADNGAGSYASLPRTVAPPSLAISLEDLDFTQGTPLISPWRASFASRESNSPTPRGVDSLRFQISGPESRAEFIDVGQRRFFVFHAENRLGSVEDRLDATASIVTLTNSFSVRGLGSIATPFDIFTWRGEAWIVYAGEDGLYALRGACAENGLRFEPAVRIIPTETPVTWLQTAVGNGVVHIAYVTGQLLDARLFHAHTTEPTTRWSAPRIISSTGWRASMHVEGSDVFILWVDRRFTDGDPWSLTFFNKLMIAKSVNAGASFRQPLLVSKRDDTTDDAADSCLIPSDDGLVVLLPDENSTNRSVLSAETVRMLLIDRQLKRGEFVGETNGTALRHAWEQCLSKILATSPPS